MIAQWQPEREKRPLEDLPEFVNQLRVIDLAEARRVLS